MSRQRQPRTPPEESHFGGPVRTCVGCRRREAKSELVRVVVGSDAEGRPALVPDPRGAAPGRGAHLHPTVACYDLAVRRTALTRALRVPAGLPSDMVRAHLAPQTDH